MFFKDQTISGELAVPPLPPLWKIPPKVRGIINETVPKSLSYNAQRSASYWPCSNNEGLGKQRPNSSHYPVHEHYECISNSCARKIMFASLSSQFPNWLEIGQFCRQGIELHSTLLSLLSRADRVNLLGSTN